MYRLYRGPRRMVPWTTLNLGNGITVQRAEPIPDPSAKLFQALKHFMPHSMLSTLRSNCRGEEKDYFIDMLGKLVSTIETMPKVYEQDGLGDKAIVYLHYFTSGADFHITERDTSAEQHQAFGLADFGYGGELGYISIAEMLPHPMVNLDLYWTPKTLEEVKAKKEK